MYFRTVIISRKGEFGTVRHDNKIPYACRLYSCEFKAGPGITFHNRFSGVEEVQRNGLQALHVPLRMGVMSSQCAPDETNNKASGLSRQREIMQMPTPVAGRIGDDKKPSGIPL